MPLPGATIRGSEVGQLVTYQESANNFSTSTTDPATLISTDVLLRGDLVYRIYGRSRAHAEDSDDFGKLLVVRITVDGTAIDEARNNTASSTSTAATNWATPEHPAYTPATTDTYTVALVGARGGTPSWTGHAGFRGSGGASFVHRLAIYVVGVVA
jgi:hypothetical protein